MIRETSLSLLYSRLVGQANYISARLNKASTQKHTSDIVPSIEEILATELGGLHRLAGYIGSPDVLLITQSLEEIGRGVLAGEIDAIIGCGKIDSGLMVFLTAIERYQKGTTPLDVNEYHEFYSVEVPTLYDSVITSSDITPDYPKEVNHLSGSKINSGAEKVLGVFSDNLMNWLSSGHESDYLIDIRRCFFALKTRIPDKRLSTGFWAFECYVDLLAKNDNEIASQEAHEFFYRITDVIEKLATFTIEAANAAFDDSFLVSIVENITKSANENNLSKDFIEHFHLEAFGKEEVKAVVFKPLLFNEEAIFHSIKSLVTRLGAQLKEGTIADTGSFDAMIKRVKTNLTRLISVVTMVKDVDEDLYELTKACCQTSQQIVDIETYNEHITTVAIKLVDLELKISAKIGMPKWAAPGSSPYLVDGIFALVNKSLEHIKSFERELNDYMALEGDEEFASDRKTKLGQMITTLSDLRQLSLYIENGKEFSEYNLADRLLIKYYFDGADLSQGAVYDTCRFIAKYEFFLVELQNGRNIRFDPKEISSIFNQYDLDGIQPNQFKETLVSNIHSEVEREDFEELLDVNRSLQEMIEVPAEIFVIDDILPPLMEISSIANVLSVSSAEELAKTLVSLVETSFAYDDTSDVGLEAVDLVKEGVALLNRVIPREGGIEYDLPDSTNFQGRVWIWIRGIEQDDIKTGEESQSSILKKLDDISDVRSDDVVDDERNILLRHRYSKLFGREARRIVKVLSLKTINLGHVRYLVERFILLKNESYFSEYEEIAEICLDVEERLTGVLESEDNLNAGVSPLLLKVIRHILSFVNNEFDGEQVDHEKIHRLLGSIHWPQIEEDNDVIPEELFPLLKEEYLQAKTNIARITSNDEIREEDWLEMSAIFHNVKGTSSACCIGGISDVFGLLETECFLNSTGKGVLSKQGFNDICNMIYTEIDAFIDAIDGPASLLLSRSLLSRIGNKIWPESNKDELVTGKVIRLAKTSFYQLKKKLDKLLYKKILSQKDISVLCGYFQQLHSNAISCGFSGVGKLYEEVGDRLRGVLDESHDLNQAAVCPTLLKVMTQASDYMRTCDKTPIEPETEKLMAIIENIQWSVATEDFELISTELLKCVAEEYVSAKEEVFWVIKNGEESQLPSKLSRIFHRLRGGALNGGLGGAPEVFGLIEAEMEQLLDYSPRLNLKEVEAFLVDLFENCDLFIPAIEGPSSFLPARDFISRIGKLNWCFDERTISAYSRPLENQSTEAVISAPVIDDNTANPQVRSIAPVEFQEKSLTANYDNEIVSIFLEEAAETIPALQKLLVVFSKGKIDPEGLKELFRIAHNLKGAAGMIPAPGIHRICHSLENVFQFCDLDDAINDNMQRVVRLASEELERGIEAIESDLVFEPTARLKSCLDEFDKHQRFIDPDMVSEKVTSGITEVEVSNSKQSGEAKGDTEGPKKNLTEQKDNVAVGNTPNCEKPKIADDLIQRGDQGSDATHDEQISGVAALGNFIDEKNRGRKRRANRKVRDQSETRIKVSCLEHIGDFSLGAMSTAKKLTTTIKQGATHGKKVLDTIEELGDITNRLMSEVKQPFDQSEIADLLNKQRKLLSGINENASCAFDSIKGVESASVRMEEDSIAAREELRQGRLVNLVGDFKGIESKVKSVAKSEGKLVKVEPSGLKEGFDWALLKPLRESILHIMTNAVTHGVETRERRRNSGKEEVGLIRLTISQSKRKLNVVIQDDGGGINKDKVVEKAIEKGIIKSNEGMTDEDIYDLLFSHNFSTKDSVDGNAGRGVALGAVKKRIVDEARGSIRIESEEGKWTRFSLSLDMTIGARSLMLCQSGWHNYAIPFDIVSSVVCTAPIYRDGVRYIRHEESLYQAIEIEELVAAKATCTPSTERSYLVFRTKRVEIAVGVDRVTDMRDVVVHDSPPMLDSAPGFAGFVEDEEGKPVLVLDGEAMLIKNFNRDKMGVLRSTLKGRDFLAVRPHKTVIVGCQNEQERSLLHSTLTENGFGTQTEAPQTIGAWGIIKEKPALVVLDCRKGNDENVDLAKNILASAQCTFRVVCVCDDGKAEEDSSGIHGAFIWQPTRNSFDGFGEFLRDKNFRLW